VESTRIRVLDLHSAMVSPIDVVGQIEGMIFVNMDLQLPNLEGLTAAFDKLHSGEVIDDGFHSLERKPEPMADACPVTAARWSLP